MIKAAVTGLIEDSLVKSCLPLPGLGLVADGLAIYVAVTDRPTTPATVARAAVSTVTVSMTVSLAVAGSRVAVSMAVGMGVAVTVAALVLGEEAVVVGVKKSVKVVEVVVVVVSAGVGEGGGEQLQQVTVQHHLPAQLAHGQYDLMIKVVQR